VSNLVPAFFTQETGQGFLLACGAIWLFWREGAPAPVLYIVGALSALYIVGEKIRAIFHHEPKQ
jgi:hypothetical protein